MKKTILAMLIQEGGKLVSEVLRTRPRYSLPKPEITPVGIAAPATKGLTTEETIKYQRREIGKELLLLEKHLQQGCKIDSKPCDCCEKHPLAIEGLAQEALGMTADPVFNDVVEWAREIIPRTTEEASTSGKFDKDYPRLATKARQLRKAVMGTESVSALQAKKEVEDADTISPISTTESET